MLPRAEYDRLIAIAEEAAEDAADAAAYVEAKVEWEATRRQTIDAVQAMARRMLGEGSGASVEDFLAERRAEAKRE